MKKEINQTVSLPRPSSRALSEGATMKLLISSIIMTVLFSGCFQSENTKNIDFVKNGVMEFDKTLTVGQAFSSWKDCSNKKWTNFKTENGRKIVQFDCNNKTFSNFIDTLNNINKKKLDEINISNIKLKIQWTLNVDNTFQLHSLSEEIEWENGFKFNYNIGSLFLEKVYNNKQYFENIIYDKNKIRLYGNTFYQNHKKEIDQKRAIEENKKEYIQDVKKYFKDKDILNSIKQVTTIDELYEKIKNKKNKRAYILQNLIFDMMSFNTKSIKYLPVSKNIIDLIVQDTNLKLKENIFTYFFFMNTNPKWATKASIRHGKYLNQIINYMIQYPKIANLMKTNALDSKRNIFSFYVLFDEVGSKETIKTYENMINIGINPTINELSDFETIDNLKSTNLYKKLLDIKNNYIKKYGNEIISQEYIISYDLNKKTTKKIIIKYKSTVKDYFDFMITSDLNYNVKNKWKHSYMTDKSKVISKKAINELFELIKPNFIKYDIKVRLYKKY